MMAKRLIDQQAKEEEKERARLIKEVLQDQDQSVTRCKTPSRIRSGREGTDTKRSRGEPHE